VPNLVDIALEVKEGKRKLDDVPQGVRKTVDQLSKQVDGTFAPPKSENRSRVTKHYGTRPAHNLRKAHSLP